ncbi:urease accessory protein UreD [Nitratireductor sp. StC3]|uniref:urease accessory protein UreD n=1 Tax=Nitratireductor sp. StC3 TaxID=2126741 RepID=UPI000D0D0B49|nr:urease accessory protein UreD [Nitratireductor sp. StC3]PSM19376.1 urease accessory protein [Nitratireductor sp. StC3]
MDVLIDTPADCLPQRADGHARLVVQHAAARTCLRDLHQAGAAKIRLPRRAADPLEAVLINTAGGLTGGDRLAWSIEAGPETALSVTSQACEKIYRSGGDVARIACTIRAGAGSRIAWLPQETILFDHSALTREIDIELDGDAQGLFVEATLFGRLAMGERIGGALMRDRWRVRSQGRLVHAEDFALDGAVGSLIAHPCALNGGLAMATVLKIGGAPQRSLSAARAIVAEDGGVSAWQVAGTGKLLARIVAADGYALRKRLVPLIGLLNEEAGVPKFWSF